MKLKFSYVLLFTGSISKEFEVAGEEGLDGVAEPLADGDEGE